MYIFLIAATICLLVAMTINKLRQGGNCCGEHEATAKKVCVSDTDLSHYPYRYEALIEGMVCANCVRNAENAFNSNDGIFASIELRTKTAAIYSKHRLERRDAAAMLEDTTYTLTGFREVEE